MWNWWRRAPSGLPGRVVGLGVLALLLFAQPVRANERDEDAETEATVDVGAGGIITRKIQVGDRTILEIDLIVYFAATSGPITDEEVGCYSHVFGNVSRRLWDATDRQMRLGRVYMGSNPAYKARADIWVVDRKDDDCWGKQTCIVPAVTTSADNPWRGGCDYIVIYREKHLCEGQPFSAETLCAPIDRASFGIVHELGHYLFGVGDEYSGDVINVTLKDRGRFPPEEAESLETDHRNALLCRIEWLRRNYPQYRTYYCSHSSRPEIEDPDSGRELNWPVGSERAPCSAIEGLKLGGLESGSNLASIMDGGTSTSDRNYRTEFCTRGATGSAKHRGERNMVTTDGTNEFAVTIVTTQESRHAGLSCWETIYDCEFVKARFPERMKPSGVPDSRTDFRDIYDGPPPGTCGGMSAPLGEETDGGGKGRLEADGWAPAIVTFSRAESAYVLAVDTSGSMGDLAADKSAVKIDLARTATRNFLDLLKEREAFGIVNMDERPQGRPDPLPILQLVEPDDPSACQEGVDDQRSLEERIEAARDAVDALDYNREPNADTALGDALQRAREMLDERTFAAECASGRALIVLSDGRNTGGDNDPMDVACSIRDETNIVIHAIAFGPEADQELLQNISKVTGGRMYVVDEEGELPNVVPNILKDIRGEVAMLQEVQNGLRPREWRPWEVQDVLRSHTSVTFHANFAQGVPFALELVDPGGNRYTRGEPIRNEQGELTGHRVAYVAADGSEGADGEFLENDAQIFLRLNKGEGLGPEHWQGDWIVRARNNSGQAADVGVFVSGARAATCAELKILRGNRPLNGNGNYEDFFRYPNPIPLQVSVFDDAPVLGASVKCTVAYPRGATFTFDLHDDGKPENGDEFADDGIYSALFSRYLTSTQGGGDGAHVFTAFINGKGGTRLVEDDETGAVGDPSVVEGLRVISTKRAIVLGIPAVIGAGALGLTTRNTSQVVRIRNADIHLTPVLNFVLRARQEYVRFDSVKLDVVAPAGVEAAQIPRISLFEASSPGVILNPYVPLASGWLRQTTDANGIPVENRYDITFEKAEEPGLVVLASDSPRHFVVAVERPRLLRPVDPLQAKVAPRENVLPTWVLLLVSGGLLLLLGQTRPQARKVAIGTALVMVTLLTGGVGCGGGGGGGGGGGEGGDDGANLTGQFILTVDAQDLLGVGLTSNPPYDPELHDPDQYVERLGSQVSSVLVVER